jgi:hypothetical protein
MAKKTTTRAKSEIKTVPPAEAAAGKPKPRARTSKKVADNVGAPGARDTTSVSMASEPSEEDIRLRAYHRYLQRGGGHGMDFEDWLEAKRELRELNERK